MWPAGSHHSRQASEQQAEVSVDGYGKDDSGEGGTSRKSGLSQDQVEILRLCRQKRPLVELMNASGRRNRTTFRDSFINPLLEEDFLGLTIPGKPRSRRHGGGTSNGAPAR